MFEDSRGVFWVGTSGDGLHTLDRKTGRFERHTYDPAKPDKLSRPRLKIEDQFAYENDQVTFILEDGVGSIWIGSMWTGLNRYDPVTKKITHYESSNGFPDHGSWNAYQSRDGVLWITTQEDHLYRVDPFRQSINHISTGSGEGGTSSFLEDKEGFLWVGTRGKGLFQFDQQKRLVHHFVHDPSNPSSIFNDDVNFIFQHQDDTLWISTHKGLGILNKRTLEFSRFHMDEKSASLDTSRVMGIMIDRLGLKWVSTWENGLFRYNAKSGAAIHYLPDPNDPGAISTKDLTSTIHEDRSGILWFGSFNGLNRFDRQTEGFKKYLEGRIILTIHEGAESFLVGTDAGLYKYNPHSDSLLIFNTSDEFAARIYDLIEDDEHNLWIYTPSVIIKLNPARNEWFVYGKKFGIDEGSMTPASSLATRNGQLLKGTENGFYFFSPKELASKIPPSQIIVTDFFINNLPALPGKESPLVKPIEETSEITLSYDLNNFSFNFAADDYRTPNGV